MTTLSKTLHSISDALVQRKTDAATNLFNELVTTNIFAQDMIRIFDIFPRVLTVPHVDKFLDAEQSAGVKVVSQSLMGSKFEGVDGETRRRILPRVVSTLSDDDTLALEIYQCHLELVAANAESPKVADEHAEKAICYAIRSPTFFGFEALVDDLQRSKYKPAAPSAAQLLQLVQDVFIGGAGLSAAEKLLGGLEQRVVSVTEAQLRRKAQLLSLPTLLKPGTTVPFAKLYEPLSIQDDEAIQQIAIDAQLAGIVRVRVDLKEKSFIVLSAMSLKFDNSAWKGLKQNLDSWVGRVDKIIQAYESP